MIEKDSRFEARQGILRPEFKSKTVKKPIDTDETVAIRRSITAWKRVCVRSESSRTRQW
jgi:hypothetical protein